MEIDWLPRIISLLITLIFSAFFSGSEVALFSLGKMKLNDKLIKNKIILKHLLQLVEDQRRLLVTILLGNTLFNVAASILSVLIALDIAATYDLSVDLVLLIQIILLTILVLFIGEVTPKVIASKYPLQFSKIVAIPLYWIGVLIYPVAKILTELIKSFASIFSFDRSTTALLSSEISDLAEIGAEKGTIDDSEHELIHGLVNFKTVTAREVMTPRVDIISIPVDSVYEEVIKIITDSGRSRLPLYDDSLDNIVGIIYAKDLLPFIGRNDDKKNFQLKKISRKVIFIPETKLISEIMNEFQEANLHVGIVVDEYGGTSGLISLEDILEEIVGEIRDEYDKEETEIVDLKDNNYMVLGKVSIDELNELLDTDLTSENDDYDTIGGFIFNHTGSIPENGDSFEFNNLKFTVEKIENNRINKVLIELLKKSEENE